MQSENLVGSCWTGGYTLCDLCTQTCVFAKAVRLGWCNVCAACVVRNNRSGELGGGRASCAHSVRAGSCNLCAFCVAATIGVVKSRDMHWGLLAQRDHKDINLSSLRMLLVADGANPCEYKHVTHVSTTTRDVSPNT